MLATEASATGAAVVADALAPDVMTHLERDVASFIDAFDGGYEPPSRPGSLTSGARRRVPPTRITTTRVSRRASSRAVLLRAAF